MRSEYNGKLKKLPRLLQRKRKIYVLRLCRKNNHSLAEKAFLLWKTHWKNITIAFSTTFGTKLFRRDEKVTHNDMTITAWAMGLWHGTKHASRLTIGPIQQENLTRIATKIELCVRLSVCGYSMYVTLCEIGEEYFRLLGTNDFHVKARKKNLSLRARVAIGTSNIKISRRHLAATTSKNCTKKRAARAARLLCHPYFNQSSHWFVALSWPFMSSSLKLRNKSIQKCGAVTMTLEHVMLMSPWGSLEINARFFFHWRTKMLVILTAKRNKKN